MSDVFLEYKSDMSIDEKSAVIKENTKIANNMRKQMVNSSAKDISIIVPDNFISTSSGKIAKVEPFDEKFIQLYQAVVSSSFESLAEAISSVISQSDPNYFKYISMLKIKLYEDMVEASNLAFESRSTDDPEVQRMYSELNSILVAIDELEEEEELLSSSQNCQNRLFFMTSLNRVVLFEKVDKDIPMDMYDQVLDLLKGMINGEFKGLKYLHAKKMFEVRLGEVRITFAKLSNNKFVVLDCFLKKFVSNQSYRDMMYRTRDQFLAEKADYLARSDEEDFINEHQKYLDDIISLCENKGRVRE